ncbi:MAG: hypothetical protein J6X92_07130 [Bacteroidales bacterium]|nr:hypothetical protein [Bacteroidales bacterium]
MRKALICLFVLVLLAGCVGRDKSDKRIIVAKAGRSVLYLDQIPDLMANIQSEGDSLALYQSYISKWAKKELVYQKSNENLTDELRQEINKQVRETQSNLVIYQYEKQMMFEQMDTTLTDYELENYYMLHLESFALRQNIIKTLFVEIPIDTKESNKIRNLVREDDPEKQEELNELCYEYALEYTDYNGEWIPFEQLAIHLPNRILNEENFLKTHSFYETRDTSNIFFVKIRDYNIMPDPSPFEYVKDDIKRIVLNNRRIDFLQNLEDNIFNEAIKNNTYIIY